MEQLGRTGHRWSTEELNRMIGMHLAGKESSDIAKEFSTSISAINKMAVRLRKNGIPLPYKKRGHVAGRRNRAWTQEEVEYVVRRKNENASNEEISTELNRTFYGILGIVQKMRQEGVEFKQGPQGKRRLWDAERLREAVIGRGLRFEV